MPDVSKSSKVSKAPTSYKTVEIMQQCKYGFTADYIEKNIVNWVVVKDYAYIIHDKDVNDKGVPVEPHIHLMIRFSSAVPTTAILSKLNGVCRSEHLQKCHSWSGAIGYLCHTNSPDKYQYDDTAVHSNFDWQSLRDIVKKFDVKPVVDGIADGTIKQYNIYNYIDAYNYTQNKTTIERAFEYRLKKMRGTERTMNCIFISGKSGSGKTTYAKKFAKSFNYECYVSSGGKNPLDNYEGQECIILDDCRPSTFALSDFLKLTDPYTDSLVGCRYYNKSIAECKLLIVTSVLDLPEFYNGITEKEKEPIVQLYRRFPLRFVMDYDTVKMYRYDDELRDYVYTGKTDNVIGLAIQRDRNRIKNLFENAVRAFGADDVTVKNLSDAFDRAPDEAFNLIDSDNDNPF